MNNIQGPNKRTAIPRGWAKQGTQLKQRSFLSRILIFLNKLGLKIRSLFSRSAKQAPPPSNVSLVQETTDMFKKEALFSINIQGRNPILYVRRYADLKNIPGCKDLDPSTKTQLWKMGSQIKSGDSATILAIQLSPAEVDKITNR